MCTGCCGFLGMDGTAVEAMEVYCRDNDSVKLRAAIESHGADYLRKLFESPKNNNKWPTVAVSLSLED